MDLFSASKRRFAVAARGSLVNGAGTKLFWLPTLDDLPVHPEDKTDDRGRSSYGTLPISLTDKTN